MKTAWISALIGALLFASGATMTAAFQATPDATPAADGGLPEVVWHLTTATLADGTVHTPEDPSLYTIQFLADGRVSARADCNQAGGDYTVDGASLELSALMTTLVGCPEGSLGSDYTAWLEQVVSFELTDDGLVLSLDDGGTLSFVPALPGVTWEWQRFQGGDDSEVTPEHPENYTLQFEEGDRVLVRADCNTGSGSAVIEAPGIEIEQVALTRMFCGDDSLDQRFVQDLTEATSFAFAGGQLVLALPMDAGLLFFAARAIQPGAEGTPDAETAAAGTPASN